MAGRASAAREAPRDGAGESISPREHQQRRFRHHRQVSENCFRLVSLKQEVQNDQAVVKPVLEELEVMRLSCALGMLSSVSPTDFAYDTLQAREFDEDFARFLRKELFGQQTSGGLVHTPSPSDDQAAIRTMGVFGKQAEVKQELARWKCWSEDCETKLHAFDQGIYCVYLKQADSESQEEEKRVLVLFAWLQDALFESEYLRDTPTYVLRFLTSLSPDITCTLSQEDVQRVEQVATHLSMSQFDEWKSFSVAFRVEKQQDEQDAVHINHVKTIDVPELPIDGARFLVKGNCPGLVIVRPTAASVSYSKWQKTFTSFESLSDWMVRQSKTHKMVISHDFTKRQRDVLLQTASRMPTDVLDQAEQAHEQNRLNACEACRIEAIAEANIQRSRSQRIADTLFSVDVLTGCDAVKDALKSIENWLSEIKHQADKSFLKKLRLPVRLKKKMISIYDCHLEGNDEEGDTILRGLHPRRGTSSDRSSAVKPKVAGIFSNVGRAVEQLLTPREIPGSEIPDSFRRRMVAPLSEMKAMWLEAAEQWIDTFSSKSTSKEVSRRCAELVFEWSKVQQSVLEEAFGHLLQEWHDSSDLHLTTMIAVRHGRDNKYYCHVEEEFFNPARSLLQLLHLDQQLSAGSFTQGLQSVGEVMLEPGDNLLGVFTLQKQSLLVITVSEAGTRIDRVQFPVSEFHGQESRGRAFKLRTLVKKASRCDFDLAQRTLALVSDAADLVGLYKFNEQFTAMELIRTIDIRQQTSLSPPLADLLLVDSDVFLCDGTLACQSVNRRNLQISKRANFADLGDSNPEWRSSMFAFSDGLVLGCLAVKKGGVSLSEVIAVSSEDHRVIPVMMESDVTLQSTEGVTVQCVGSMLYVLDPVDDCVQALRIDATIRSDSYKIQHSSDLEASNGDGDDAKQMNHWLWAFYHVYEKFPVQGMISRHTTSSVMEKALRVKLVCPASTPFMFEGMCKQYLQSVMSNLQKLNKPLGVMDLARDMTLVLPPLLESRRDSEVTLCPEEYDAIRVQSIRSFLRELITFIPIQICRAEGNTLTVMSDGQDKTGDSSSSDGKQLQTYEIARSIRFGLLSPILEAWRGRCVVITSMGKQSTGKSYYLNHLTGSSFAIAGARCTDGAWMTVRMLPNDVLLVVLDFEGLGSFERTEQEDVFLSVLNAAISMFTVFRMEMRFDKEIDDIFSKFQKGVQLIKNDPKLFRGKLYMSVKDVNPNDQRGVLTEFVAKFQKLLGENKDNNFLSDLYSGQLDINSSPPLGTSGYYHSLMHAQQYIERRLCGDPRTGFANGKQFLDCMRLLLAKISILDWTSLDESNQKMQLTEIRYRLPGLIRTGCLIPLEHASDAGTIEAYLKEEIDVDQTKIVIPLERMLVQVPDMAEKWLLLDDTIKLDEIRDEDIDLGFDICKLEDGSIASAGASLLRLFEIFLGHSDASSSGKLVKDMQINFDVFLAFVVARRKLRVMTWVTSVLGEHLPEEWKSVESQFLTRFQLMYRRCPQKCERCQLGCMLSVIHSAAYEHDCKLGHQCQGLCEYCQASDRPGKTPVCSKQAGHEGMCECANGDHTCAEACCLASAPNCGKKCSEKIGHDGVHHCSVQIHRCGQPCCARDCLGRCILSFDPPHTAHKCEEVRCIEKCLIDGCTELCGVMDHFHGQTDIAVAYFVENPSEKCDEVFDAASENLATHMCSKAHVCQANCSEKGNCYVEVFHKESTKTFSGARGEFQYKYQEMNGFRKKCTQVLLPGQQTHPGSHSCVNEKQHTKQGLDRTLHYCEYRCPCCSYFCRKEFGHLGMHATSHGNMRNTYFLADTEDIDIEDRKYKTGELGVAEMCNLYCSKMGRGHVHYLECEQGNASSCVYVGDSKDQRRHCGANLVSKSGNEVDEVLHEQFWKTLGWEDPCTSASDRAEFAKCSHKCDAPSHEESPSYCVLPAWHKRESKPVGATKPDSFAYIKGHKFKCSHVAESQDMHHVFVLDCSGSMQGDPWKQLMTAWQGYMKNRVTQGALRDVVSAVTFDNDAVITHEQESLTSMLNAEVRFRGGGTRYGAGLRAANEIISRSDHESYRPVLVFFSDGSPDDDDFASIAHRLGKAYTSYDLRVFVVGFGNADLGMLKYVADKMEGEYLAAITGNELKEMFYTISTTVGSHVGLALSKPVHERLCSICQSDLASGEVVQMQPCLHDIHAKCWKELVVMTNGGSKTACPICRKEVSM